MADIKFYFPKLLKWEGGFVQDPIDKGGATNMGVTLSTFQAQGHDENGDGVIDVNDLKLMSKEEAMSICKQYYWDRWMADTISNQSIAEQLVEWVWGSGKWGIIIPQRLLGVVDDGIVGYKTIQALNGQNQSEFFIKLTDARMKFINDIVANNPDQIRFQQGWKNRINNFKFFV